MNDASGGAEVLVICGPTAAGKSAIALELAARHGRDVLVADSRQVYRGFDIGTAKPTAAEQRTVRHHGIDLAAPTDRFSAAQWTAVADGVLSRAGQRLPIVVGGTGLYLRALFEGLFREPTHDPGRRASLLDWLDRHPTDELRRWVSALDPERSHLGRTQLLRAVEVALLTGVKISDLHRTERTGSRWRPRYLVIDPGVSLRDRIARRFDEMLAAGWLEEVKQLCSTVPHGAPAWKSSGYRVLRDVVEAKVSLDEARERILIETRQYAKRQRTWFRHQLPENLTTRLDPERADVSTIVERWFEGAPG